ncbi:paired box protein Pax-4 [Pseudonaja textilis]|uniref:paired box protein Pax-4 n=1 Tax=Pseudonaja textilis TaxID=8673 RepID=UPI000EA99510|nr:paired box protein Pax-4 [Pseudonaja textilis]
MPAGQEGGGAGVAVRTALVLKCQPPLAQQSASGWQQESSLEPGFSGDFRGSHPNCCSWPERLHRLQSRSSSEKLGRGPVLTPEQCGFILQGKDKEASLNYSSSVGTGERGSGLRLALELRRVNQLGGFFVAGCPLPDAKRKKIVELALCGLRAADISHQLKVSSGCVSKILTRYYKVGLVQPKTREGSRPQIATPQLVAVIAQLKQERPSLFAWEIREKLEAAGTCAASGIPSISSINRILRRLEAPGGSPFLRKLPQPGPFLAGGGERKDPAEAPTSPSSLQSAGLTGLPRTRSRTVFSMEQLQRRPRLETLPLRHGRYRRERKKLASEASHDHISVGQREVWPLQISGLGLCCCWAGGPLPALTCSFPLSAFQRSQYPEAAAREELAGQSGLPEATLKVWFSNRRARGRREALRAQHAGSGPATPGTYLAWGCV